MELNEWFLNEEQGKWGLMIYYYIDCPVPGTGTEYHCADDVFRKMKYE